MKKILRIAAVVLALLVASAAAYRHFVLVQPLLDRVRDTMNDPESAQFRNLRLVSAWSLDDSVLCGEVNGRNLMGGYVGFRHFEMWGHQAKPDFEAESLVEMYDSGALKRCNYLPPWWGVPF